ncbi:hypothetical protein [Streptomyces sp. NRRL F-2580]|nr:hypothetical protein [Streptomyces sp. NRRL F-2580]
MKWNLRLAAANRGIWKAGELRRMPAAIARARRLSNDGVRRRAEIR